MLTSTSAFQHIFSKFQGAFNGLGLLLRQAIVALGTEATSSLEMVMCLLLGIASIACQDVAVVVDDKGRKIPLGIFMTVLPHPAGGNFLLHRLLEPILAVDREASERMAEKRADHKAQLVAWQARGTDLVRKLKRAEIEAARYAELDVKRREVAANQPNEAAYIDHEQKHAEWGKRRDGNEQAHALANANGDLALAKALRQIRKSLLVQEPQSFSADVTRHVCRLTGGQADRAIDVMLDAGWIKALADGSRSIAYGLVY